MSPVRRGVRKTLHTARDAWGVLAFGYADSAATHQETPRHPRSSTT